MSSDDFVKLMLQLTAMLCVAVLCGRVMRLIRQPSIVGEMIGGIILGPTVFGLLAPSLYEWFFTSSPNVVIVREAATKLGMLFFLFYAGLQINLADLRRLRNEALFIGLVGTLLPIGAGVALVYALPREFWGPTVQPHYFAFALFVGMNLANSANPVIARILMDLGLLNRPIGSLIMCATIVDDLVNWTLFAIILNSIDSPGTAPGGAIPWASLALVALLFAAVLLLVRRIGPWLFELMGPHTARDAGLIAVPMLLVLIAGSAAEALGIHAFLGAFLVGVALGGGKPLQQEAHDAVGFFALSFFAPIYFISMGMSTNFLVNFDLALVMLIFVAACVTKIGAVLLGAWVAGMPLQRDAWAIGFGLNARGATGLILAGVGLANNVIDERLFVAVAVMALLTSAMSGPMISRLLWNRVER